MRAFEPAVGQAVDAAPIEVPVRIEEEIPVVSNDPSPVALEPDAIPQPVILVKEAAPVTEEIYVPWQLEISGEDDEESLDIPELEEPVFPIDPLK